MKQTDRKPSHFVSNIHSGSEKGSSTSVASMGLIIAGMRDLRAAGQVSSAVAAFGSRFLVRFAAIKRNGSLSQYQPRERTGAQPSRWLRCIIDRVQARTLALQSSIPLAYASGTDDVLV